MPDRPFAFVAAALVGSDALNRCTNHGAANQTPRINFRSSQSTVARTKPLGLDAALLSRLCLVPKVKVSLFELQGPDFPYSPANKTHF